MTRPKRREPKGSPHIQPRIPQRRSTNQQHPLFSLQYLVAGFRVSDCQPAEKAAFADRLQAWGQMTWAQIMQVPREGLGTETLDRDGLQQTPPGQVTPDVRLLALRFGSGARVIGYRDDEILHIIWTDPNHKVYRG